MKSWIPIGLIFVSVTLSVVALFALPYPYLWVSLIWLSFFWLTTYLVKGTKYRAVWFNLGFVVLALVIAELYSAVTPQNTNDIRTEGSITKGYYTSSDILGYTAKKGISVTARKFKGDELVFDVVYTIDENGLRVSPPTGAGDGRPCILFFGGSYTFGEGVNDHEAMPYIVGELTNAEVYNFGFHGYGPQQMLSAIEHGLVEETVTCQPTHAIYQAIHGHIARSAGLLSFSRNGPKYILLNDGSVKYDGHFDDGFLNRNLYELKQKSFLYNKYFNNRPAIGLEQIELFMGIVASSRDQLEEMYPGIEFHTILWIPKSEEEAGIIEGFEERDINLHLIKNVLPDYPQKWKEYQIQPGVDGHPNPKAHEAIARYVATQIIDSDN